MPVTIKWLRAGYCVQSKNLVLPGASRDKVRFYAGFALLRHHEAGYILFDTGYSPRFLEATRSFPYSLYARVTPVVVEDNEAAAAQLLRMGISPVQVRMIVLSHFHADHMCGLRDFPEARFLCFRDAYEDVRHAKGFAALKRAFVPGLMPDDFRKRLECVDDRPMVGLDHEFAPFQTGHDLLGDGSVVAVRLSGHAAGQMGLLVKAEGKTSFLVADACWLSDSYRRNVLPHPLAGLMFHSRKDYQSTLNRLHELHRRNPGIAIIPSHCAEPWEKGSDG